MNAPAHSATPRMLLAAAFVGAITLYWLTLCPTVFWDDSGELITAAYVAGVPHPPGQPLYTMLGWVFTHLPGFSSPAYAMNFMSAVFGALAWTYVAGLCFDVLLATGFHRSVASVAALAGAWVAAAGRIAWSQAVIAENTTLHAAFVAALLWWAWRIGRTQEGDDRRLLARLAGWAFVYGLSTTNHPAGVFLFPAFAAWFVGRLGPRVLRPRWIAAMLLSAVAGLIPYVYLYVASRANPPLDWGNPETWDNFVWVVTARAYADEAFRPPTLDALGRGMQGLLDALGAEWTMAGGLTALVGWGALVRRERLLALIPLLVLAVFAYLRSNPAYIDAYLVPLFVWLVPALAVGIGLAMDAARLSRLPGLLTAVLALVVVPAVPLAAHWSHNNRRTDDMAERYGRFVLDALPRNAILLTESGNLQFVPLYLMYCENVRRDIALVSLNQLGAPGYTVTLADRYPDVPWPVANAFEGAPRPSAVETMTSESWLQALADAVAPDRRIFLEDITAYAHRLGDFVQDGYLYEFSPAPHAGTRALETVTVPEPWDPRVLSNAPAGAAFGNHVLLAANVLGMLGRLPEAAAAYTRAAELLPGWPPVWNHLGITFAQLGRDAEAEIALREAVRLRPESPTYAANLMRVLDLTGRSEEALIWARRTAAIWTQPPTSFLLDAAALEIRHGSSDAAARHLETALARAPRDAHTLLGITALAVKAERSDLAIAAVQSGLEQFPRDPAVLGAARHLGLVRENSADRVVE